MSGASFVIVDLESATLIDLGSLDFRFALSSLELQENEIA